MTFLPSSKAQGAALRHTVTAACLNAAAQNILPLLEAGQPFGTGHLRAAMVAAFGASDAEGAWDWKAAYDACEGAQVLLLRAYGRALMTRAGSPQHCLAMWERIARRIPTHTRRSESGQSLQQFSTPLPLAYVAAQAACIRKGDLVLEPSAGTGMLAIHAELARANLALNELDCGRSEFLARLFPGLPVTRHDAASIDDRLDGVVQPDVVLMNPPFSAMVGVDRVMRDTALRHLASALARLRHGGRLVAIVGANCSPDAPAWSDAFDALQQTATLRFSAAIPGQVYAKHGTTMPTRLLVFDKVPDPGGTAHLKMRSEAPDLATFLQWIEADVPRRPKASPLSPAPVSPVPVAMSGHARRPGRSPVHAPETGNPVGDDQGELVYSTREWQSPEGRLGDTIYEPYTLQSLCIDGARPHPTALVQSAAMASVAPPRPSYRPNLPKRLVADGILSDAQLESVVYAGEAHSGHLSGAWAIDETWDTVSAVSDDMDGAIRFRRGWFLGDGTGAGKGRQVAGIILDNWLKGRRRAVWLSVSDRLLEDAQRDWAALGQERLLVTPLSRFRQGTPIRLTEGILFTTYATLRSQARGGKVSRVEQIVEWLGRDFDGVIVFDEAHAMANAAGGKGARGEQKPSQQGRAGLRLQHALPNARIVYVSATGATTVQNLAYAQRLGLWGGTDFPFASRSEFVAAIEEGGVAAMEVLARDLKALGLYAARSLSFDGVEYELLEHQLTDEQRRIYDSYAGAFQVIHNNLDAAMEASGVTSSLHGTLNPQAKSAARSAFESTKQRFFNHLITAMQTPATIASIACDLEAGNAAVVQIVSTGEALQERRLAEIPADEWGDVSVDITPREYVLDYLAHSFPVQLYEPFTDSEGNLASRAVFDADGNPVFNRQACRRCDAMIEKLASLPPVPGALDQIVQHFGADAVAEVTGRSRRIVPVRSKDGSVRFAVQNRPSSANLAETRAFMDDEKRILVFSEAGGTGRSYHADLGGRNQRRRIHYLLEPGWKADSAIQGFGRTNRTNQKQPPLFRPVTTDVKAQKRFISTIARRLDTLGAITRGQRQTGGQNMFRSQDNLESAYARDALRQLYRLLADGKVEGCSLLAFEAATGLSLMDEGGLKDELPPITTFLNRMLALTIDLQNILFETFEGLLASRIEGAVASGTFEMGLETLRAESFTVLGRQTIYTHPGTGAQTQLLTIERKDRIAPVLLADALDLVEARGGELLVNARSGRAAVKLRTRSLIDDDGSVHRRFALQRPLEKIRMLAVDLENSHWQPADLQAFAAAWNVELGELPEYETSTLHIVSGLLLPIWKRLPKESTRVYRLQTDTGERIIGRKVTPAWAASVTGDSPVHMDVSEAWRMLGAGEIALELAEGQTLRRVRAMNDWRIELSGFNDLGVERLKAMGLISEIVWWKLKLYVPAGAAGADVFAALVDRFPIVRVQDRKAA
ncbi:methyltransferase small domain protein (plasmid) [Blastomonas sp. RAC04]|uniref:strawberry notch-like NTP hydrolase domain-containing protein n=1 Tax=Blastomonas sp. RAC04 TaxID=1842535 RepID=UPI00083CB572|nr:strawberry notch family protein [Blastomonas sp. RAC04]AOF98741.1 methyltransferase small domain protein [Blastomonas sp. RAC04]